MKAIILNPAGGEVDRLFQYDKGCKIRLYIKDAANVIVDYSCTGMVSAATVQAASTMTDCYEAEIPNYVLEYGNAIKCHIGYLGADNRQIVDSADLAVEKRTRPADFITENPAAVLTAQTLDEMKLNKNQGTENAGKVLIVGDDGELEPGDSSISPETPAKNKNQQMILSKQHSRDIYSRYENLQLKRQVSEMERILNLQKSGLTDDKLLFIAEYDERYHKRDQFPEYLCTEYNTYAGNIASDGTLTFDKNDTDAVQTTEDKWGIIHVKYTKDVVMIFDKIKPAYDYYLYFEKHSTASVLYAEYDKTGSCLGVKFTDENSETEGVEGIIKFNKNTARVAFYIPRVEEEYSWKGAVILNAVLTIDTAWEPDYYTYGEVMQDGYLPNPDSGILDFYYTEKDLSNQYVFDTNGFMRGSLYNRWGWSELYDETTGKYDFSKPAEMYKNAIEEGTRVHDGIFMTAYSGHGNKYEDDSRIIYYLFPKFVFDIAFEAAQYPLRLLKTGENNGKIEYMAIIDWRNETCQTAYKNALQAYRNFLEQTEYTGIKFIDVLTAMQIRFFGLWGEGHLQQLIEECPDDLEDAETMISIVKMYEEIFGDKYLIAPIGGFSKYYEDCSYKEFQNYYIKNSKFGFFNDHIGQTGSFNYIDKDFDGTDVLQLMQERYKTAPIEGELYNYGEYRWELPVLPYIENDVRALHLNSFRYTNLKGGDYTYGYDYEAVQEMLKNCYDIAGSRLFFVPICSYISGMTYIAKFFIGNMGVAPLYGKYWMPRIIIRNPAGEIIDTMSRIMGAAYDLKNIGMMPEPGVPSWKSCTVVTVSRKIRYNTDYTDCQAFLTFEDADGISEPLFLANTGRTAEGEYPLGYANLKSQIYTPEDESKYKYLFDVTFDVDGAHVVAGNVTVTEHVGADGDGYTEDGWKNTSNLGGVQISGIDTSTLNGAKNLQLCVEFSDVDFTSQYRKAFLSAEDNVYTVLYSNSGYTFVKDTSDFWNHWGYRTIDGMGNAPRGNLKHILYYDNVDDVRTIVTSVVDEYDDTYEFGYADHNIFDGDSQADVDMSNYIRSLADLKTMYLANTKNWNVGMIGTIKRAYLRYEDGEGTYYRVKFNSNSTAGTVKATVDGKEIKSNSRVLAGTIVKFEAVAGEGAVFEGWTGTSKTGTTFEIVVNENVDITAIFSADVDDGVFIDIDFTADVPADRKKNCTVQKTADHSAAITGINWDKLPDDVPVTISGMWSGATIRSDGQGYLLDAYNADGVENQVAWLQNNRYGIAATIDGTYTNGQSNNYPGSTEDTDVQFTMHFEKKSGKLKTYDFSWGGWGQTNRTELWCTTTGGNAALPALSNVLTTWNEIYLGCKNGSSSNNQPGNLKSFKITYEMEATS